MSLIITLHGEEGIVMAGDSRISFDNQRNDGGVSTTQIGVMQADTNYKVFTAGRCAGLSYCGTASVNGVPIAGYVQSFIRNNIERGQMPLEEVPAALVAHFRTFDPIPATVFHLAGYSVIDGIPTKKAWRIYIGVPMVSQVVPDQQKQGAIWDGEQDILTRLIHNEIYLKAPNGTYTPMPYFSIPFEFFTLQDMVDFATYAIRTTSDSMRFQLRPKTVSSPIDILVVKPEGTEWIARKQITAP